MHSYSTPPKETDDHCYNHFKGKKIDDGVGLHIDTLSLGINLHHDQHSQKQQQDQHHHHHHHQQQQQPSSNVSPIAVSCEPPLSPAGSPSSSTSSLSPTTYKENGLTIPSTRVARNRSIITRKSSISSPTQVTSESWEHLKSPAASFLASFASPSSPIGATTSHRTSLSTFDEEQQGDEIDDYVMNEIIGYGGFSTVRKGYCISDGQTVAIKIIKKKAQGHSCDMALERELEIWENLDHQNVVRIQKVLETDYATYIICDYCANGSLLQRLLSQPSQPLDDQEKKRLFSQLCNVLDHLHRKCNVVHKDIKLDNILLDDDMNIKLCDFGLAVYQRHSVAPTHLTKVAHPNNSPPSSPPCDTNSTTSSTAVGGSLAYCAPEQIKASHVLTCPKTDVWSLGVVLYAMFAGRLPFDDDYDVRLRQSILAGQYDMPDSFSPELADLISHCLEIDPAARYSLEDVMNHPWLK
ncbi:unnamed protein product [Absidia cylindrospora]